jgi:DNA-nicking Smr family endonuclease
MKRRSRPLHPDEAALWAHVAKSIAPLPGRELPIVTEPAVEETPSPPAPKAKTSPIPPAPKAKPKPKPLAPIDRRLRTALRRGTQEIDGVLDLHGLRQDEAHGALRRFLHRRQADGAKTVLVITGKGAAGMTHGDRDQVVSEERGVLRRVVPHWLRLPDLRPLVLGFEEAQARHGGSGALYVRLRRPRQAFGQEMGE